MKILHFNLQDIHQSSLKLLKLLSQLQLTTKAKVNKSHFSNLLSFFVYVSSWLTSHKWITLKLNLTASKPSLSNSVPLVSQTATPRLTPPGSPPALSASSTPKTTSRPISPRRHSVSFSTTRGMFDDNRSSISISEPGSHTGKFKNKTILVEFRQQHKYYHLCFFQDELGLMEKSSSDKSGEKRLIIW